jgi:hypothetical protein
VPEAATQVYTSLGYRWDQLDLDARRDAQRRIYWLQVEQEQRLADLPPRRHLLLDRGTIDGAAYWPDGPEAYWRDVGTTAEREIARYDLVIILESSAAIGMYDGDASNRVRFESAQAAIENSRTLADLWTGHPNRHFVKARTDLADKTAEVEKLILGAANCHSGG